MKKINSKRIVTVDLDYFGSSDGEAPRDMTGLAEFLSKVRSYTLIVNHHDIVDYVTDDVEEIYNIDAHTDLESVNEDKSIWCGNWMSYLMLKYGCKGNVTNDCSADQLNVENSYISNCKMHKAEVLHKNKIEIDFADEHVFICLSPTYTMPAVLTYALDLLTEQEDNVYDQITCETPREKYQVSDACQFTETLAAGYAVSSDMRMASTRSKSPDTKMPFDFTEVAFVQWKTA